MRRRWSAAVAAAGAVAVAAVVVPVAPARAATIVVDPGESIQAAVDAAQPGDTILVRAGVYRESVTITKDAITLVGEGANTDGTVIAPPASPEGGCEGFEPGLLNGVCVLGDVNFDTFTPTRYVQGGAIRNIMIRSFTGTGLFTIATRNYTADRVRLERNGDYGMFALLAQSITISNSVFRYNHEPALYVGNSPRANATVTGNRVLNNDGIGMFFREAGFGTVRNNRSIGNCAGMLFLDHDGATRTQAWTVLDNVASRNNRVCADEEGPPLTGLGIGLAGTRAIRVERNQVNGNQPGAPTPVAGGILLLSSTPFGGQAPDSNAIVGNTAFENQPYDIAWDGSGAGNTFSANDCGTSDPPWICSGD